MLGKSPNQKEFQLNLYVSPLQDIINPNHSLIALGKEINWNFLEESFKGYYSTMGAPSKPIRLMVGLLILKHLYNLSDERVVEVWVENPYYQYFTGGIYFSWQAPCAASDLVHFRHRIGEEGIKLIFEQSVELHKEAVEESKEVLIDTTVEEKNITYPTDTKLAAKVIKETRKYADELGIHAIGVDISAFNALISNVKISKVDFTELYQETERISKALKKFVANSSHLAFEKELAEFLTDYDKKYFPSPEFKIKVRKKEIDEESYTELHEKIVLKKFYELITKYQIKVKQDKQNTFLEKWYLQTVRNEIDFVFEQIKEVQDLQVKNVLTVILSRTIRSCRATTHADLATLLLPKIYPAQCLRFP